MNRSACLAAVFSLAAASAFAESRSTAISGEYVEARTAEVFAGGCIMSSEAETIGRQAVMAWRIDTGAYNGVALDGLSVVAAVNGDRNLGIREIGGEAPSYVKAAVYVDERATPAQRDALVRLARTLSRGLISEVVQVTAAPIRFDSTPGAVTVTAGEATLAVQKRLQHNPGCGAMKWFTPFSVVDDAALGMTDANSFSSKVLGTKWSDPNRKSAFFGTFHYEAPELSN
jgi:hypothetical protein